MSDHMELSVDCKASEVRVCRGCLAVRCKLYDIQEKRLEQVFSDLTGLPVCGGFLCSVCLHLVYKFKAFREYCRNSGYILNHMFLINEDSLSSINRSNLRMPLSRSRMFNVHLESTREPSITDNLHIHVQDEKEAFDLENDIKSEDSAVMVENFENNIENIRFDKVEMASLMDNDANKLTDDFTNEINFTDLTEKDDDLESNVDDDTNEPAPEPEPVKQTKINRTKPKFEYVQDEKKALDLENDIKTENSVVMMVEIFENNIENIGFDKVEMASLMDNDVNKLTDDFTNEIDFTDLTEKDDEVEANVDDDTNEHAPEPEPEPVKQTKIKRTKPKFEYVQDEKEALDLENDIKSEDSVVMVENFENNIENIGFDKVEMASLMDNDVNKLTDDFTNEIDFTDLTEKDDDVKANVDDDRNEPAPEPEPVKQTKIKRTKLKFEKDIKTKMCKYFSDIWIADKKENGDHYEILDRLYKFSLIKERPEFPRVFLKKKKKSEVYNFMKFLDLYKEIADIYKVDVEFISIIEERRAMDAKRKALAQDSDYCGMCCKKYVTAGALDRHMKLNHNETRQFRCEVCLYTFKIEAYLLKHLFKFHCTKKKCRECDQAIVAVHQKAQWTEVQLHIERYHRRTLTTCEFCGQTFTQSQSCYHHIRQEHRGEINAVQCLLCGDSYNGPLGLRLHVHKTHTEAVKCATCAVFFQNQEAMATHVTETGECRKDVRGCPMCGATFSTDSLMKQHYDDVHAKYKCNQCVRTFIEYDCYKIHYNKICSDGQILPNQNKTAPKKKCVVCGKAFNMRTNLTYHMRMHTGEKPFKCEQCGKTFRVSNSLRKHSWTHTSERPYKCQLCPKAFQQQRYLKLHMAIHIPQERRHKCSSCDKSFVTSSDLKKHVRYVHLRQPRPNAHKPAEPLYNLIVY